MSRRHHCERSLIKRLLFGYYTKLRHVANSGEVRPPIAHESRYTVITPYSSAFNAALLCRTWMDRSK